MTTTHATLDPATADRLGTAFNRCFETLDDPDRALADDVFADLYPPFWRFQVKGRDALLSQLRAIAEGTPSARVLRIVPTSSGFVLEHEETQRGDETLIARRLWLCEVRDDRITEILGYCNGGWDDALRARHAAEAPMVRP